MEMASSPRSVEEIFKDFNARRTAVLRALTLGTFSFISLNLGFLFFFQAFNAKVLTFFVLFLFPFSQMLMNFTDFVIQVKKSIPDLNLLFTQFLF